MSGTGARLDALLAEQIAYYRARADEYDDWFLRRGEFDRGPEANRSWFDEVERLRALLDAELERLPKGARVLELACGTGLWTERLAARTGGMDAVDAAPEVLALNRGRLEAAGLAHRVRYQQADLFAWRPQRRYPLVFFGFWLSHVPEARFESFWQTLDACLADGGRFFFVDNLRSPRHAPSDASGRTRRALADGRGFDIVKIFHEPASLARRLSDMGFDAAVSTTPVHFLHGSGERR